MATAVAIVGASPENRPTASISWQQLAEGLGGDAIGEDGLLPLTASSTSQAWIDAFSYYSDMFNVHMAAPQDDTVGENLFASGNECTVGADLFASGPGMYAGLEYQSLHPFDNVDVQLGRFAPSATLKKAKSSRPPAVGICWHQQEH